VRPDILVILAGHVARTYVEKEKYIQNSGGKNLWKSGIGYDNITHDIRVIHSYTLSSVACTYQNHDSNNHQNMDTHLKQEKKRQYSKHFASSGLYYCYCCYYSIAD
jgi:hypothetical protein